MVVCFSFYCFYYSFFEAIFQCDSFWAGSRDFSLVRERREGSGGRQGWPAELKDRVEF